jgi:hypothetical protein
MKCPFQPFKLTVAVVFTLLSAASSPLGLTAQAKTAGSLQFRMPAPPSRGIPTGRYRGGASRGVCPKTNPELTALVPFKEETLIRAIGPETIARVWGLTSASHPTFWFYMPYDNRLGFPVEFALQDEDGNDVYRTGVDLPTKPGIVRVTLPSTVPALEAGQVYHWYFKVYCAQKQQGVPIQVEGVVLRITPDRALQKQIESATPLQKVALYAENHLWYDTVTTLADLRSAKPEDPALMADWHSLLKSIQLSDVADAPLTECCKALQTADIKGRRR